MEKGLLASDFLALPLVLIRQVVYVLWRITERGMPQNNAIRTATDAPVIPCLVDQVRSSNALLVSGIVMSLI